MDCVYYVVGGDRRSCYMSLSLAEKGSNVFHFDPYDADLLRHSPVTIISGASGVGFRRLIEGECASPSVEMLKATFFLCLLRGMVNLSTAEPFSP